MFKFSFLKNEFNNLSELRNKSTWFVNKKAVEKWILSKVLNPNLPYFFNKIAACSKTMLSKVINENFVKSFWNKFNVMFAKSSFVSFVLTFFRIVEENSIF